MTAKPISIKGTGGKFGGGATKAVDLTSGDPLQVTEMGLRVKQFILTLQRKSAEGKVSRAVGKAREALRKPKGGATDRPSRERRSKARTVLRKEGKESDE